MQSMLMCDAATPTAEEFSATSGETIFVPFLGRVFDVQSRDEAQLVARASAELRRGDFALLSPREFERLITATTASATEEMAARLRERAVAVRRGDL